MIDDAKAIIDRLNSPLDWALVIGAGTIGFALDAAINIVPFPLFSPGYVALAAATGTLSIKRGCDAAAEKLKLRRRSAILKRAGERIIKDLRNSGRNEQADELEFELELNQDDLVALETAIKNHRLVSQSFIGSPGYVFRGGVMEAAGRARFFEQPEEE